MLAIGRMGSGNRTRAGCGIAADVSKASDVEVVASLSDDVANVAGDIGQRQRCRRKHHQGSHQLHGWGFKL